VNNTLRLGIKGKMGGEKKVWFQVLLSDFRSETDFHPLLLSAGWEN